MQTSQSRTARAPSTGSALELCLSLKLGGLSRHYHLLIPGLHSRKYSRIANHIPCCLPAHSGKPQNVLPARSPRMVDRERARLLPVLGKHVPLTGNCLLPGPCRTRAPGDGPIPPPSSPLQLGSPTWGPTARLLLCCNWRAAPHPHPVRCRQPVPTTLGACSHPTTCRAARRSGFRGKAPAIFSISGSEAAVSTVPASLGPRDLSARNSTQPCIPQLSGQRFLLQSWASGPSQRLDQAAPQGCKCHRA